MLADKSLIMSKQGVASMVINLMHEDIKPEDAAEQYDFASPELRETFINGLMLGQEFIRQMRTFLRAEPHTPGDEPRTFDYEVR